MCGVGHSRMSIITINKFAPLKHLFVCVCVYLRICTYVKGLYVPVCVSECMHVPVYEGVHVPICKGVCVCV